jgi:hypothetical protein
MKQVLTALTSATFASTSTAFIFTELHKAEQNKIKEQLKIQERSIKTLEQRATHFQNRVESTETGMKEQLNNQDKTIKNLEQQLSNLQQEGTVKQVGQMVGNAAGWFHNNYSVNYDSREGVSVREKDNTCTIL